MSSVGIDSMLSATSIDAHSFSDFETLPTMYMPIRSSITLQSSIDSADGIAFKVTACQLNKKTQPCMALFDNSEDED